MRLIYADDFLDLFYVASAGQDKAFIRAVEMVVEDTPIIEAEPVRHGRWETFLDKDWGGNTTYLHGHKKCGYVFRSCLEKGTPYCPNCGAKMDGDSHD